MKVTPLPRGGSPVHVDTPSPGARGRGGGLAGPQLAGHTDPTSPSSPGPGAPRPRPGLCGVCGQGGQPRAGFCVGGGVASRAAFQQVGVHPAHTAEGSASLLVPPPEIGRSPSEGVTSPGRLGTGAPGPGVCGLRGPHACARSAPQSGEHVHSGSRDA